MFGSPLVTNVNAPLPEQHALPFHYDTQCTYLQRLFQPGGGQCRIWQYPNTDTQNVNPVPHVQTLLFSTIGARPD